MEFHRRLFVPPRRRFIFLRRLRNVLRRLRDGGAWRNDEWGRPMNGRQKGERFFLDRKIAQSEARNFLPVKYANFVRCCFCDFRLYFLLRLLMLLIRLLIHYSPLLIFLSPLIIHLFPLLIFLSHLLIFFVPLAGCALPHPRIFFVVVSGASSSLWMHRLGLHSDFRFFRSNTLACALHLPGDSLEDWQ